MIDLILPIKNDDFVMIFQFAMITKESYHWPKDPEGSPAVASGSALLGWSTTKSTRRKSRSWPGPWDPKERPWVR